MQNSQFNCTIFFRKNHTIVFTTRFLFSEFYISNPLLLTYGAQEWMSKKLKTLDFLSYLMSDESKEWSGPVAHTFIVNALFNLAVLLVIF